MTYLPHTPEEIAAMLQVVGADSLDGLFATIPETCCCRRPMDLPEPMDEWALNRHMDRLAGQTAAAPDARVFVGAGSYDHVIPAALTYVRGRSEFVTSYTPYQPEISQGTLQAIYEYQTLASRLMGTDVATASHYDGATALAESLLMAVRKTGRKQVAVSSLIHPHYRRVVQTYFRPTGYTVKELSATDQGTTDLSAVERMDDLAAVAIQSPNFFGCIEDLAAAAERTHEKGALFVGAFTEAMAYGLLKSPGSLGADIVCGEGQSLGLPRSFGGPGLGMLGSTQALIRSLPGRLVGKTTDLEGRPGFVLTLATREQHIRREKATSNICTNASLCALTAVMFMAFAGGTGFARLARLNRDKAEYLKAALGQAGFQPLFDTPTFNEFAVRAPSGFAETHRRLVEKKIVAGLPLAPYYPEMEDGYLFCATETASREEMDALVREVKS